MKCSEKSKKAQMKEIKREWLNAEYAMERLKQRELTEPETLSLFQNFLRYKLGLRIMSGTTSNGKRQ